METTSYQNSNYKNMNNTTDKAKTYLYDNENYYKNSSDASKKGTLLDSNTSKIGGGFELEKYTLKSGGKFLFAMIFLCSLAGLSLVGIWTFAYGTTTEDIKKKIKDPTKHQALLISGSILTVLSSIIFIITIIRLHNEKEKELQ
tara:strand:- start:1658 stop:2089 length:432 start_codon:yes stop_codon:yes gene_type:complete